jgi:hypothetical protein
MPYSRAEPGWYGNGQIADVHADLGLVALEPESKRFSILVPIDAFPSGRPIRAGLAVDFRVGNFGGVTEVQFVGKPQSALRPVVGQSPIHVYDC